MPTTTDELLLRVTVDAKTGALRPVTEDLLKLKERSNLAGDEVDRLAKKVNAASIAFERKQRAVNNTRESIIRAQSAFIGFGGTVGQVTNHVFDLTNQMETLEFNAKKAGKSIDLFKDSASDSAAAIGKLGTAALVAGAAIAGWKIGRVIGEITGLDGVMTKFFSKFPNFIEKTEMLLTKLHILEGQSGSLKQSQQTVTDSTFALAKALHDKYGVAIDFTRLAEQKYQDELRKTAIQLRANNPEVQKLSQTHKEHAANVAKSTVEVEKLVLAEKKLSFSTEDLTDKVTADNKAWDEFGKKLNLIVKGSFEDIFHDVNDLKPAMDGLADIDWNPQIQQVQKLKSAWESLSETLAQVAGIFGALADAFGSNTLGSIANAIGGAGQAAQGFGEIMSGDVLQGIQDVIAGVGNLFKALKDLFGHNWKKDAENIISAIHGISGASDEFIQSVADLAKKIGDADTALILSLKGLIDDVGITADNVAQIFQLEHDVFSFLERGQITVQQASEIIDSTFNDLVAAAEKFGGVYQQQLTDIIALSRQFGLDVPAITAYVNEQIGKMIEGISTLTQQFSSLVDKSFQKFTDGLLSEGSLNRVKRRFDELARYTLVAMSQILQNGGTMVDVFTQLHDPFEALQDAAEKFGLKGSKSFQKLMDAYEKFNSPKTKRLLAQVEIIQAEQALGVELTKHEKHLLKIAEEQGLIKADPMQQVADAVKNDLVPAIEELIQQLSTLTGRTWNVDVNTNYSTTGIPPGGGGDRTYSINPGGGGSIQTQAGMATVGSTTNETTLTNNNRLTINVISSASNARALAQDLEPYIEKFLRNGTISRKDGSRF